MRVGYARVSTAQQDLAAQIAQLAALEVDPDRIYTDHGLTGANRERPGLREAMAACRSGDTLVVTKLDRLARSVPDARDIAAELIAAGTALQIGSAKYDPTDPIGRLLFNILAMVAEFESDLIRARTREGMQIARAKGRLKGKPPKLSGPQERHLMKLVNEGQHTQSELAELFGVGRTTVYRTIQRNRRAKEAD
ncbi:recombinase family protein [Williamsia muralis]|uniref:recombinase family protein n=1 Tax=Williamsia marianensis TaxID=85044 RepID=UPI003F1796E7